VLSKSPAHASLGLAIRHFREDRGFSQEELASKAGLHRTYVGGIERGERNPSYANILRLAEALGVRASEIVGYSEGRTE
jgi:transcriptional regulator with XRE-family HTH domain